MGERRVRSVLGAVTVPGRTSPYDTVHWRCYHPAVYEGSERDHQTGELAPDPSGAPWPLVVLLPGVNIDASGYRWLAESLVGRGNCVVVPSLVGEHLPGHVGLTPGIDAAACQPDAYGGAPTCDVLRPLLDDLARRAAADVPDEVCRLIDLDRIAIGGHSGGGTVALQSASRDWFPVAARFAFAGHTMASTMLGYPPDTVLPLPGPVPTLLLGAEFDGVVRASVVRYGTDAAAHDPVAATFDRAVIGGEGHDYLAVVAGAVHTSCVFPDDDTLARGFLDPPPVGRPADHRAALAAVLGAFLDEFLLGDAGATVDALDGAHDMGGIAEWRRK